MNESPTLLELCIRHIWIVLSAYAVYVIASPMKFSKSRIAYGLFASVLIGMATGYFMRIIPGMYILVMLLLFFITVGVIFRFRPKENFPLTLISFGVSYSVYYFSVFVCLLIMLLRTIFVRDEFASYEEAAHYLYLRYSTVFYRMITLHIIILINILTMLILLKSKRVRKGLELLVKFGNGDVGLYLSIAVLSIRLLYSVSVYTENDSDEVFAICFFLAAVCIFMIYFWIKKEIRSVYISRNQENELSILERSLASKDRLIETLREDNECLAELIHKDNKLIPSMVMSVRKAIDGDGTGLSQAAEAADSLNEIYAQRCAALSEYENHSESIPSTGVTAVDAVLLYMYEKAKKAGVALNVAVDTDVSSMLGKEIERSEFNVMLADLAENAILSAANSDNGMVKLKIGLDDGVYYFEASDNGKLFETEVLCEMGRRKITTRSGKGGSGIGLMSLFRIIRNIRASFVMEEYSCVEEAEADYTKTIRIVFDGKSRMELITYRAEEFKGALERKFDIVSR